MGNYIQFLIINYNGKESEKEYIYTNICITEPLCSVPETNTTLLITYSVQSLSRVGLFATP